MSDDKYTDIRERKQRVEKVKRELQKYVHDIEEHKSKMTEGTKKNILSSSWNVCVSSGGL